jgi:hypothetical protein
MTDRRARRPRALPGEVVAWRAERLAAAGFHGTLARALSRDPRVDLHALIELTERGCPPDVAARIEAPIESGSADALPSVADDPSPARLTGRWRR